MDYAIKIVEQSGKDLTDYQIRVEITDEEFFSKCADQKYVEFYDEDKQTLLPHYTELFDPANNRAVFWVKVPSIPANGTKFIYLNINTERTEDLSDPEAVFDFWDDFEGDSLDTNKWWIQKTGGGVEVSDSILKLHGTVTDWCIVNQKDIQYDPTAGDHAFEFKIRATEANYFNAGLDDRSKDGNYIGSGMDRAVIGYGNRRRFSTVREGNATDYTRTTDVSGDFKLLTIIPLSDKVIFKLDGEEVTATSNIPQDPMGIRLEVKGSGNVVEIDFVAVRKYTDPEPSVTVIRLGATPTYELKLKIAQALAGEATTILDTDPKIRLLSGTDIIKELSLTAKTVYKDATNNRVVVAFLFVDDSSDEYTADNLELLFTKDNTEYVAFKSNKSFTKEANKRLPLRWEIYLNYDVDVCTYEESMVTCL